jgi:hypothetical protein
MNIPSIFDWLARFEFLRGWPAVYLVLLTAVIIVITWDWRGAVLALAGQYLVTGLLFVDVLDARLAMVKMLVGLFVCIILYVTARQVNWGRLPVDVTLTEAVELAPEKRVQLGPFHVPTDVPLRLVLTSLLLIAVLVLAQRPSYQLLPIDESLNYLNLAVLALIGFGLLGLSLTTEPLQAGMGILMLLLGFELFYSALEQSVAIGVVLAAVNLIVAVAIAHLTHNRHAFAAMVD